MKIGTISEEFDSLGICFSCAQLMNISCMSDGLSCLRWNAEIPSGPGALEGLIEVTALVMASVDGTNIWAPLFT